MFFSFFFIGTPATEIYTLSLHDALPIYQVGPRPLVDALDREIRVVQAGQHDHGHLAVPLERPREELERDGEMRSEEHTSELQSLAYLVCRLLLEKKKRRICVPVAKRGVG